MAIAIYAPSLAIQQGEIKDSIIVIMMHHIILSNSNLMYENLYATLIVTGISTEVSTAVIYFVCIFYSAIVRLNFTFHNFSLECFLFQTSTS